MIICICENVSDRALEREIDAGARTVREIRKACGAGGNCGSCVCDLKKMLARVRDEPDVVLPAAAK